MKIQSTEVIDTFAEAFKMWATRIIITAENSKWALEAAHSVTGFATSVIGCKCEIGIEAKIPETDTPDNRPGISILIFAGSANAVAKRIVDRVGQCIMTCPTTACFNGLDVENKVKSGGKLRYFGDGFQASKLLDGRRIWRIPVMEGEFLVDDSFGVQPAVGGGNILLLGNNIKTTLRAAEAAVIAMRKIPGIILPFPGGIVRSGSKPGSKYKALPASTNDAYCPTLRSTSPHSELPPNVGCVFEIVIDGLDEVSVARAMRSGIHAAAGQNDPLTISAGNYGGKLGEFHFKLHQVLQEVDG